MLIFKRSCDDFLILSYEKVIMWLVAIFIYNHNDLLWPSYDEVTMKLWQISDDFMIIIWFFENRSTAYVHYAEKANSLLLLASSFFVACY